MRFDLWGSDLVDSARDRVLSDVAWNNDTWPGPWWLLHGLASIGSLGLGGYAWQQSAVAAKSLPRDLLARQPEWLALLPDIAATGDAHMLRDAYGTRFAVVAAFEYPGGIDPSVYLGWLYEAGHIEELVSTDELSLLGEYFRGPRCIQDIIGKLGDQRAEPPEPDPELATEEFSTWYSAKYGDVPDEDAAEGLAEEWLGIMLRGSEHLVSPQRVAAF